MSVPHQSFIHVPVLNPAAPVALPPGKTVEVALSLGESTKPSQPVLLRLRFKNLKKPDLLRLSWNRKTLKSKPLQTGVWVDYAVPAEWVEPTNNSVELTVPEDGDRQSSLTDACVTIGRR